ncbi:hypothetical protein PVAND_013957 [Polypedilum vanderplanki]|uniref:Cyclin-dependent kinase inhibitor n=1 Tax=Polypedilum vanderplanki TaxID=319348 RepID=A0A9J6CSA5_POLVA|nr:hypothetical protein PVAND_013957 [Polypedilum vanderplanki]
MTTVEKKVLVTKVTTATSRRRISPRSLSKCQTERARKAKLISKSLFGMSNKAELREHIKATGNDAKTSQWEFDFETGKPAKVQKNYKWEAVSKDEVPQMYHVNHIKRLHSAAQNQGFEGQLPKLRYYHHIKKIEPQEENNNVPVITQPITASAKKNGSAGQLKITDFLKEKKRLTVTAKKKQRI